LADALDDADGDEVELVPDVPAALEPAGLVFRMNFELLELLVVPDVPVVPGVLLGDALERSMHPVTVTLSAVLELGDCELGGVCAATAIATVHTIAAANPMLFFIVSS
jgi:hypothetical protein